MRGKLRAVGLNELLGCAYGRRVLALADMLLLVSDAVATEHPQSSRSPQLAKPTDYLQPYWANTIADQVA
jgi:hypothetical protein